MNLTTKPNKQVSFSTPSNKNLGNTQIIKNFIKQLIPQILMILF